MNGCHPGLSSSKGPFLSMYATSNFGERLWPCLSTLTKGGAKLALRDVSREQLYGFSSSSIMQRFRIQYSKIVAPRSAVPETGCFPVKAKKCPDRPSLTRALLQSKGDARDVWRWLYLPF